MAQHDYNIANQTAANLRADLNNALSAIVSNNSGATEPADTFANMFWYDTSANILKIRNEADSAWINLGYVDQSTNAFRILDDTLVTNTSGTQTGLLGDQSTATWQAGTGTTESLVSPAKVSDAIQASFSQSFGTNGQTTMPNGLIMKWGYVNVTTAELQTVTFPSAFPNACMNVQLTIASDARPAGDKSDYAFASYVSRFSFAIRIGTDSTYPVWWLALGY